MSLAKGRYGAAAILSIVAVAGLADLRGAQATPSDAAESVALANRKWGCVHTDGSDWDCPDTSFRFMSASRDIASAALAVTSTRGRTDTLHLPRGTDAVFLTRSATVRFLVPYYTRSNRAKAEQLRARLRPNLVCIHTEPSDWDCPSDTTRFMFVPPRVASASMTVRSTAGQTHTLPLPWGTDAVFLTRPAVETFLLDYYNRTDRTKARRLREYVQRP
jgi:hypothetical protein